MPILWPLIEVIGLVVCCGMAGCLGFVVLVGGILGRLPLGIWLAISWSVVWVLVLVILLLFGPRLIIGMLMMLLWKCLILLISGRGKTSLRLVGLRLLALVFMVLLQSLHLTVLFGGVSEEYGDARLERCRAFLQVSGCNADCSAC